MKWGCPDKSLQTSTLKASSREQPWDSQNLMPPRVPKAINVIIVSLITAFKHSIEHLCTIALKDGHANASHIFTLNKTLNEKGRNPEKAFKIYRIPLNKPQKMDRNP